jgi:hypothetical protein
MKFKLKKFAALAGLPMVTVPTMLASIATAQSASFLPFKDAKGDVYMSGTSNSEKIVTISGLTQTRNLTANACGVAVLRSSLSRPIPTSFLIGGTTITPTSLPTQLLPKCLASGQLEEARTANFKTADGTVVLVGQTPSATVQISYAASKDRKVKTNACAIGRIGNSSTNPFTAAMSFTIDGTTIGYGDLPVNTPWYCRNGTTYQPYAGS